MDSITTDTIFALATAPGKSGVAVLRLSGPKSLRALTQLSGIEAPTPRLAYYTHLTSPDGSIIDKAIAIYFRAPNSFTGEDIVEFHTHGSLAVLSQLLDVLAGFEGLRPAEPGEFSRRAFMQGKMDLTQAEGLADLINAQTSQQKTQALRQMEGELSGFYERLRMRIIRCLAHFEAVIDFPDEDIPAHVLAGLNDDIMAVQADIAAALQDNRRGERLRDGINVVILGAPNAGKSSLLNALAKRDAAIVSHHAGTTRDAIEIHLSIAGYPVVLVDTAGLRDSSDDIEAEGIRRAKARARDADITLLLFDGAHWPEKDSESAALVDEKAIIIVSKSDMMAPGMPCGEALTISTKTWQGIDALLNRMEQRITSFFSASTPVFITQNRHRALLNEAAKYLEKAMQDKPLELKCEELRLGAQAVGKITGKIQVDDVLDIVFSSFCIGK